MAIRVYGDDFIFKDLINITRPKDPHFYIAVNFFVVCVINKLKELGFANVTQLIIDPYAKEPYTGKRISGIKDEKFKIVQPIGI